MKQAMEENFYFRNSNFTMTGDMFLSHNFSNMTFHALPLEMAKASQITLIVVYSVAALMSLTGNGLVIVVLLFVRQSNHALNVFLLNMAIADFFMAIFCIPFSFTETMLGYWIFGDFLCPFVNFVQITSVSVSISTNMVIGIDRLLAVRYPLKKYQGRTSSGVAVLFTWVIAVALAAPQIEVSQTNIFVHNGRAYRECREVWPAAAPRAARAYTIVVLAVTYVVPLALLTLTYAWVACILWAHSLPGNANARRDKHHLRNKRKIVKMLITIVVMFALCWLPIHVFNLLIEFSHEFTFITTREGEIAFFTGFFVCHWIAMAHSFMNPIIYAFLNDAFKGDLTSLWHRLTRPFKSKPDSIFNSDYRMSSHKKSGKWLSLRYYRTKDTIAMDSNNQHSSV